MDTIALGAQGLTVSKLGFGCMGLTTAYGPKLPDDKILALLEKASELGVTLWDTANLYVFFDLARLLRFRSPVVCQEEIISRAIQTVGRENVVISTKTGINVSFFPRLRFEADNRPQFIRQQCEASLRRLNVDCIDLFSLHRIDPNTPIEISMTEMKKLVEEGKVRYVGLSECSAATLRRAHKIHPVTAIQMEWSLWCRGIEHEIVPTCAELGVGIVAYSPLGRGFFAGAAGIKFPAGDYRNQQQRFHEESNKRMADAVQKIADAKGCSTAQLSLAWVEAQQEKLRGAGVVAIPGTTKEANLINNVASTRMVLTSEEIRALEEAVPWQEVKGERYSEGIDAWETDNNRQLTAEEAAQLGLSP